MHLLFDLFFFLFGYSIECLVIYAMARESRCVVAVTCVVRDTCVVSSHLCDDLLHPPAWWHSPAW